MLNKITDYVNNKKKSLEAKNFIVTGELNIFDEKRSEIYMVKNGMLLVLHLSHVAILGSRDAEIETEHAR